MKDKKSCFSICFIRFPFLRTWLREIWWVRCRYCKCFWHRQCRCGVFLNAWCWELRAFPSVLLIFTSNSWLSQNTFLCWCTVWGILVFWGLWLWPRFWDNCLSPNLHKSGMCDFLLVSISMTQSICKSHPKHTRCIFLFRPYLEWFLWVLCRI